MKMKYVYSFNEGNKDMRNLLGGKGANLAEMTSIGLPVPRGFTVTTEACLKYYDNGSSLGDEIEQEVAEHIKELESITGKEFGSTTNPLLVSVRSGARESMPGMMDTILNLGMNDEVCKNFSEITKNPRFVHDSYRRFIQMFADVVMGFPKESFELKFDEIKKEKGKKYDTELNANELQEVIDIYKSEYQKLAGNEFPQDPKVQLVEAIKAVFRSWNNDRAKTYRRLNSIPNEWGTAVNVQEMVYGNKGETSGTGVAFTRNPATGEKKLYGEYLMNAQGEDVVAGIRTPQSIETLHEVLPECYDEFKKICDILEDHYKDMQDMEFTIEDGKLFMLQTRNGKRTAKAALKVAVDLVSEGKITEDEAVLRIDPKQLDQLLHPKFKEESLKVAKDIAEGLAASPGAATGKLCFTAEEVQERYEAGEKELILVREETSPEDIEGMNLAEGILTVRGGMTSHAAVVARGMGTCCVSGCGEIVVDEKGKTLTTKDGKVYTTEDYISLDGSTGRVYGERIETEEATISGDFKTLMDWADSRRKLGVRTNADNPRDAKKAREFGAEGIGLCRTEHMFFEEDRIFNFRRMIASPDEKTRKEALAKILPYQQADFEGLFEAMNGYPVIIRYLDPPLHEFLPHEDREIKKLASSLNISFEELKDKINSLKEFNPMMGHRGCRLSITYPEIAEMQTTAVIKAAINVQKKGIKVEPEIMIPLIGTDRELAYVKSIVDRVAKEIIEREKVDLHYQVGTMIEIPRACVTADKIAAYADFFSFGTNDLTQMTYGFSRDDASKFLNDYYNKKVLTSDPFASIDTEGVGVLIEIAKTLGRKVKENLQLGICGEHGGDPKSIEFCNNLGLNYVSCSPFRVPGARLAAAQAAIKAHQK
ncbi:MAG: pyruvate, phosphate dikinase [Bacilli bacterium]|nr:pyruvate, phosphate dikinase [Bacilli bacterium]